MVWLGELIDFANEGHDIVVRAADRKADAMVSTALLELGMLQEQGTLNEGGSCARYFRNACQRFALEILSLIHI